MYLVTFQHWSHSCPFYFLNPAYSKASIQLCSLFVCLLWFDLILMWVAHSWHVLNVHYVSCYTTVYHQQYFTADFDVSHVELPDQHVNIRLMVIFLICDFLTLHLVITAGHMESLFSNSTSLKKQNFDKWIKGLWGYVGQKRLATAVLMSPQLWHAYIKCASSGKTVSIDIFNFKTISASKKVCSSQLLICDFIIMWIKPAGNTNNNLLFRSSWRSCRSVCLTSELCLDVSRADWLDERALIGDNSH